LIFSEEKKNITSQNLHFTPTDQEQQNTPTVYKTLWWSKTEEQERKRTSVRICTAL
jgi:hypothetical protein